MARPALRFPAPDWNVDREPRLREANSFPGVAFSLGLVFATLLFTVGVWSGRAVERGSQLGQVLALAPRLATIDSLVDSSRVTLARWAKAPTRPRNGPRLPREASNPHPAPAAHSPQP